jgi:hypothetical protein
MGVPVWQITTTEEQNTLAPRFAAAIAGDRVGCFMDAAHVVLAPFVGIVWCCQRLFVKAPSGRQRLNVLAALNVICHGLFTVEHRTYVTSETVCELLRVLARAHQGRLITMILDNARDQRGVPVRPVAQA